MITVGLVKELNFISKVFNTPIENVIVLEGLLPILVKIKNNKMDVWYGSRRIWNESIEGDASMFGIESCDSLAKVIIALNNNDENTAKSLMFFEEEQKNS